MFLSTLYCSNGFHFVMLSGTECSRNIPGNGHVVNIDCVLQHTVYFPQGTFPGDPSTYARDDIFGQSVEYYSIDFAKIVIGIAMPIIPNVLSTLHTNRQNRPRRWSENVFQRQIVYFATRNKERHSRAAYRECRPCGGCRGMRRPGESVTKERNSSFRSLQSDCNGDFIRQQPTCTRSVRANAVARVVGTRWSD